MADDSPRLTDQTTYDLVEALRTTLLMYGERGDAVFHRLEQADAWLATYVPQPEPEYVSSMICLSGGYSLSVIGYGSHPDGWDTVSHRIGIALDPAPDLNAPPGSYCGGDEPHDPHLFIDADAVHPFGWGAAGGITRCFGLEAAH